MYIVTCDHPTVPGERRTLSTHETLTEAREALRVEAEATRAANGATSYLPGLAVRDESGERVPPVED